MLGRLKDLFDPFAPYPARTPPDRYWPFMRMYLAPLKRPMVFAAFMGLVVAAVETGMIYYAGRIVDLLARNAEGPEALWSRHGLELAGVALLVLAILYERRVKGFLPQLREWR